MRVAKSADLCDVDVVDACFFAEFALCGSCQRFSGFYEASREGPLPGKGRVFALYQ